MKLRDVFRKRALQQKVDFDNLPKHIGIIMDGNGRWAKKRGLPRTSGHAVGAKTFERIVEYAGNIGVEVVTVYAFSTENWKRPQEEVDALMNILEDYLDNGLQRLAGRDVQIHFIGDRSAFSDSFREKQLYMEKATEKNSGLLLNIALNYGGRDEVIRAVKEIAQEVKDGRMNVSDICEADISSRTYTATQPDPDLIIRPSGEYRLSNFFLWQGAYSELWFSNILWPDFSNEDLLQAIYDYQQRTRRFGGV